MALFQKSHLFSGTTEGTISIWKIRDWSCPLTLRGHKAAVLSITIHPSGKLALSTSKDKTLRMWNLVTGKSALTQKMGNECELVRWSPKGDFFATVCNSQVTLYSANDGQQFGNPLSHKQAVLGMTFVTDEYLATGGEDRSITIWKVESQVVVKSFVAHTSRIKSLVSLPPLDTVTSGIDGGSPHIVSISSDGFVKVWNLTKLKSPHLVAQVSTTARLVCVGCGTIPVAAEGNSYTNDNLNDEDNHNLTRENKATKKQKIETSQPRVTVEFEQSKANSRKHNLISQIKSQESR